MFIYISLQLHQTQKEVSCIGIILKQYFEDLPAETANSVEVLFDVAEKDSI